ncbi:MAG: PAS domain-containing protein [Methanomicrobiales archaeon]
MSVEKNVPNSLINSDNYSFYKDYHLIEKLMDNFPFGIILLDKNGVLKYYNSKFIHIMGYDFEESSILKNFESDHNLQEKVETFLKDKNIDSVFLEINQNNNDNKRIIEIYPIFPSNGEIFLIFEDITLRKNAEKALKEREEYLRTIFSSIQTGLMVVDCETKEIVEINDVAADLIGLSPEIIKGHICHKYVCPAEECNCPIIDLNQKVDNSERVLLDKDKNEIPIIKTVAPVTLNSRESLLESFIDISERKKAIDALKKSEEKYKSIVEKFLRSTMALMNEINR